MVSVRAGLPFRAETARLSASEGFYYGIAVLSSLIFAIYLVFNRKFLVAGVSPLTFAFGSNLVSSLCGLLYLLVSNTVNDCTKIDRRIWPFVLIVGLSMGVGQRLLLFYGQSLTSATNTAFLLGMSPVFALLLAVFFLRESLRAKQLLIITGMMGGVFLLTTAGTLTVHLGDIIILISSLIVGAEKPLTRKILLSGVQPLLAVSLTMMIGTLGLFPIAALTSPLSAEHWDLYLVSGLLFFLATALKYMALSRIKAGIVSSLLLFIPVFTMLTSLLMLGERITLVQLGGGTLILIGGYVLIRANSDPPAWDVALQTKVLRAGLALPGANQPPLHTRPGYLLIGASQSGKTSLLQSVTSSVEPHLQPVSSPTGPTRDCDWWTFPTARVLDTTGRYALPVSTPCDTEQWRRLLKLLRRSRNRQPVTALLVAVAADGLASQEPDALRCEAAALRQRITEANRELGANLPVYLILTRCDLIGGFAAFFKTMPESTRNQAVGVLQLQSESVHDPVSEWSIDSVWDTLIERLQKLRLALFTAETALSGTQRRDVFSFPEECRALRPSFRLFVETLFDPLPDQTALSFRGVFLSSALQQGAPMSLLRVRFRANPPRSDPTGTTPYFLHDLFTTILPRSEAKPSSSHLTWRSQSLWASLPALSSIGTILGPILGLLIWVLPLDLEPTVRTTLVVVGLMLVYWITEAFDHGLTALMGCFLFWVLGVTSSEVAFSGFTRLSPWFIFGSLLIGQAVSRTGLAQRLGNLVLYTVGTSYSRLLFGLIALAWGINFLIPSPNGQVATLAPLVIGMIPALGVGQHSNVARGLFVILTYLAGLFGKMFLGSSTSILAYGIITEQTGVQVMWSQWFLAFLPLALPTIGVSWLTIRWLYPPETNTWPSTQVAHHEDGPATGAWSLAEKKVVVWLLLAVILWSTDFLHHASPAAVGIGLGLLLTLPKVGVLDIQSVKSTNFLLIIFAGGALSLGQVLTATNTLQVVTASLMQWLSPLLSTTFFATVTLYWGGFLYHFLAGSEYTMICTLLPVLLDTAAAHGYNPAAVGMLWVFAGGGKLFVYQSSTMILGYSFGFFTAKDLLKVGGILTLAEGLFVMVLVPVYWPLIGIPWTMTP